MEKKKRLIVDLDNTITVTEHGDYVNSKAVQRTIDMLKKYKDEGFEIVVQGGVPGKGNIARTFEVGIAHRARASGQKIYRGPCLDSFVARAKCLVRVGIDGSTRHVQLPRQSVVHMGVDGSAFHLD